MLVLTYWTIIEQYPKIASIKLAVVGLLVCSIVFNIVSTRVFIGNLSERKELLKEITAWEKTGKGLYYPNQQVASLILKQSTKKDVYRIPAL